MKNFFQYTENLKKETEKLQTLHIYFPYLQSHLKKFISFGDTGYLNVLHGKIAENSRLLVNEMRVCRIVAFIVGFSVDAGKTAKQSFFRHSLDIAIYRRTTDCRFLFFEFQKNFLSRKMTAMTGIADDFTIFVRSHNALYYENFSHFFKSIFHYENQSHFYLIFPGFFIQWLCFIF